MGCVESRPEIDPQEKIFNVVHVNERGQRQKSARLEVTETYLVLHQRGRIPIRWPLRCLRRYGFDADTFSFESGRRCRTGPGVYTFKCRRAEALFNMLQSQIQSIADDATSRDFWPLNHDGSVQSEDTSGYLPPITRGRTRPPGVANLMTYPLQNVSGSNGGLPNTNNFTNLASPGSPSLMTIPPPLFPNDDMTPIAEEGESHPPPTPGVNAPVNPIERSSINSYLDGSVIYNTNDRPPSYSSSGSDRPISVINPIDRTIQYSDQASRCLDMSYVNIEPVKPQYDLPPNCAKSERKRCRTHVYENVDTDRRDDEHVYANLCPDKRGPMVPPRATIPSGSAGSGSSNSATTTTETDIQNRRINYIHLDLDKGSDSSQTAPLSPLESVQSGFMPEHHSRDSYKGYAQIDIAKTEALAAMRETRGDSSRRTRHNSVTPMVSTNRQSTTLSD